MLRCCVVYNTRLFIFLHMALVVSVVLFKYNHTPTVISMSISGLDVDLLIFDLSIFCC